MQHVYKSIVVTSHPTLLHGRRRRQLWDGESSVEGRGKWKKANPSEIGGGSERRRMERRGGGGVGREGEK